MLEKSVTDAKAARAGIKDAEVHDLPSAKRTAKKATKRAPARNVPAAAKKAAAKRKPRSA
ncbi:MULTISPECIES: hypothetical protein [unclassified Streptomyces]|uniref:hypothetical protein n=1 Tax=unclassified Streptomyces TaxID=2593676 RepID=UPI00288691A8|nr:hypothetical protein [Streptomyces sp. DSM 41633]